MNDFPIKEVNGTIVYVHDVTHVRDGFPPQTNIVRASGQRATLVTVLKTGDVSTLDVISGIQKEARIHRPNTAACASHHPAY